MHPELLAQDAHQHVAEVRRSARKAQAGRTAADHRASMKSRAGWTLVQIGLRLATSSADA
jgi:hypothetical protein